MSVKNEIKKIFANNNQLCAFLVIEVVFGIVVHAEMIFQQLARHDELLFLNGYYSSSALAHGRWTYALIAKVFSYFFGIQSISGMIGVIGIILIVFTSILVGIGFKLNKYQLYLFSGIMIVMPTISSNLGYNCTSLINFFGIFLAIIAALTVTKKKISSFIIGTFTFVIALGEYQWHFALYAFYILVFEFLKIAQLNNKYNWKAFFSDVLYYMSSLIVGVLLYVLITYFVTRFSGVGLTEYAGTNSFGVVGVHEYFDRIKIAYLNFFRLNSSYRFSVFSFKWSGWLYVFLIGIALCLIYWIVKKVRGGQYVSAVQLALITIVLPLTANFVFVLYPAKNVHSLHVYQYVLFFILVLKTIDYMDLKFIKYAGVVFCMIFVFLWWQYDDLCYTREEIIQTRTVTYVNRLISRIEETSGYSSDMSIYFYSSKKAHESLVEMPPLLGDDMVVTVPYNYSYININTLCENMKVYCGCDAKCLDSQDDYEDIINSMSLYPSDGSIVIVDNKVIVKI